MMNALDADVTVESYQYEGMTIEYVSNAKTGRIRRYIPDFMVNRTDGTKELIEVKPSKRLVQRNVQKKIAAAEEWCRAHGMVFRVITEHELRAMGLL